MGWPLFLGEAGLKGVGFASLSLKPSVLYHCSHVIAWKPKGGQIFALAG